MTTLHDYHLQHAREFISLGEHSLPRSYRALSEEYASAQTAAMFDLSALGKLQIAGKDREALLHRLTTNEMRNLPAGQTRVNVFTTAKGRVVDRVEMLAQAERFLLFTSIGRAATLRQWIEKYTFIEDVKVTDLSHDFALIGLRGNACVPRLCACLQSEMPALAPGTFMQHTWRGNELLVHCPERASLSAVQLLIANEHALALWQALHETFAPIGYDTYETLRVMQGIPSGANELTEEYNPYEVGLSPLLNFEKGCYIGQEVIARLDTYQKVQREMIGVNLHAEPQACASATLWLEHEELGKITSVAHAPSGRGAIGLALVRKQFAQPGARVQARTSSGEAFDATLVALPFAAF